LRQAKVARKVPQIDRRGWRHANKRTLNTNSRRASDGPKASGESNVTPWNVKRYDES